MTELNFPLPETELNRLPRGLAVFSEIVRQQRIYVDKTELIYRLACSNDQFFLHRPRRFGKTLLINTFESLFANGLRDFKGLAIEKMWHDTTYDVMHLNLALGSFATVEQFCARFHEQINAFMLNHPVTEDAAMSGATSFMGKFTAYLRLRPQNALVLLIDEYDAPLTHCLGDSDLFTGISNVLSEFYEIIKDHTDKFRFMFVTGICKFKNLSLFSGPNHIADISLNSEYGSLLGYTADEVRRYFWPFIENAAHHLRTDAESCFAKMKAHYDGFCFDAKASEHVFCPWSVLNFLKFPSEGFWNYWYGTGGTPSVLLNYLQKNGMQDPEEYGQDLSVSVNELDSSEDLGSLNETSLLFHTGYLSIKGISASGNFLLNASNKEVSMSLARLYADRCIKARSLDSFADILLTESPENIVTRLNLFITALDYKDFKLEDESAVRSVLQLCLMAVGINPKIEVHNHKGRSDLEVLADGRYFVFELKYHRDGSKKPDELLSEAVCQIRDNHYGEQNCPELPHIRIAMVFSERERRFTHWKVF